MVTGGGRGLGRAIADELTERGVVAVACALRRRTDAASPVYAVDVRRPDEVAAFVALVEREFGPIGTLVNNAGWVAPYRNLEDADDDEFRRYVDTNIGGVFHFLRQVIPRMRARSRGRIVNVSSRAATKVHSGLALYSATKLAVRGLTQAVAKELAESGDFLCVSVSPGGIDTEMRASLFGAELARSEQSAASVARIVADLVDGSLSVPTGADVEIVAGKVTSITAMR